MKEEALINTFYSIIKEWGLDVYDITSLEFIDGFIHIKSLNSEKVRVIPDIDKELFPLLLSIPPKVGSVQKYLPNGELDEYA